MATLGTANVTAGGEQRVDLKVAPGLPISKFECVLEYDAGSLALESIDASESARRNGILRIRYIESPPGKIRIATESAPSLTQERFSHLATVSFATLPSSRPGPHRIRFPTHTFHYNAGGVERTLPAVDGAICIVAPRNALSSPSPNHGLAEGNMRMDATNAFFRGETPAIRYFVKPNAWENSLVDVYVAVLLPDNRLFYFDAAGGITRKCVPADRNININTLNGVMRFATLPPDAPLGRYVFYATLTRVGGDPLNKADRISILDTARFEVITAPAGFLPRPLPTVLSYKKDRSQLEETPR